MKILIIEDDINVIKILNRIIKDKDLGTVIDFCTDGIEGIEKVKEHYPNIVLVDLLMPKKDGIFLVRDLKPYFPDIQFIMISQVSSKDMIAKAYESGVEFYINKPVNAVEVENVIRKVTHNIETEKKLQEIRSVLSVNNLAVNNIDEGKYPINEFPGDDTYKRMKSIMQKIGIIGECGCDDIINTVNYIINNDVNMNGITLKHLLTNFNDNPKTIEQRIRRTAYTGMSNLANLGLDDYFNDIFTEYSTSLYSFQEVRKEMEYIKGKRAKGGKVNVKKFIEGIASYCEN